MENFKSIKIDNRLNKSEIKEVKELSKNEEQIKSLLETNKSFKDFIDSEYRWSNENYLAKNWKTVKYLQNAIWLKWKDIDWIFWKQTFFKLIKFQKANGLIVDWLAWNKTQAQLLWKKKYTNNKIKDYFEKKENNTNWAPKLANFLEQKWYPTYKWWAMCWLNVWELLIDAWFEWLPKSGRDWYKWSNILDHNQNFIKKSISHPNEALPGWILVYDKWEWRTVNRQNYGHVEIVWNDWYWFWWRPRKRAWWSTLAWFTGYVYYPRSA